MPLRARLRSLSRKKAATFFLVAALAAAAAWHVHKLRGAEDGVASLRDGQRFVFVSARGAAEVAVIDGKFDRIAARVSMPAAPKQLFVSEPTATLVAGVAGSRWLDIVELPPGIGRARIDLGFEADALALSPDGYLVAAYRAETGILAVASLQAKRLLFRLDGFRGEHHFTFSHDGSQLYDVNAATAELAVIDLVQQRAVESLKLYAAAAGPLDASALTRTPDGRYGFVAMKAKNRIVAVDLTSMKRLKDIPVGGRPLRPYATADGRVVLVPNDGDRSVSIIDSTTLQVVATLPGAADVTAINTGWFESFAFVMSGSEKRIVVLDLEKFVKAGEIELPSLARPGVVNGAGDRLFAPLAGSGSVAVIETRSHTVRALIDGAGSEPWAVAMAHSNNYCH